MADNERFRNLVRKMTDLNLLLCIDVDHDLAEVPAMHGGRIHCPEAQAIILYVLSSVAPSMKILNSGTSIQQLPQNYHQAQQIVNKVTSSSIIVVDWLCCNYPEISKLLRRARK